MKTRLLIVVGIIPLLTIPISTVLWTEYGMVCNNAVSEHLDKYSNVFESGVAYYNYSLEEIGFPFGVHGWNIKECVDFIIEQRNLMKVENMSPICQNAISDWIDAGNRLEFKNPLVPIPGEIPVSDELKKQKNDATLTVLNNCEMESWTDIMNFELRSWEKENEN